MNLFILIACLLFLAITIYASNIVIKKKNSFKIFKSILCISGVITGWVLILTCMFYTEDSTYYETKLNVIATDLIEKRMLLPNTANTDTYSEYFNALESHNQQCIYEQESYDNNRFRRFFDLKNDRNYLQYMIKE